jgi:hypothetical protein
MKLLYIFLFLFLGFVADSQKLLKGIVFDSIKNKPLVNATVFLSGTSFGTKTNEQGNFAIRIPPGKFSLIVIYKGFKTHNEIVDGNKPGDSLAIRLKIKPESSKKTFKSYKKSNWERWSNIFIPYLIGNSINAQYCKIKNTGSFHFFESDETGDLFASADEPLIIDNEALGYIILYKLESFHCNFNTILSHTGYSFFQPMKGDQVKQKRWEINRKEAYFGSIMHFMRSVYFNQIAEEGFDVRFLRKVRNIPNFQQNQNTYDSVFLKKTDSIKTVVPDSSYVIDYNDQILNPDNYKDILGMSLPGDSIAYAKNKYTATLDFNDFLLVVYRGKEAPLVYQQLYNETGMTSQLILTNGRPIEIEANGSYYDPTGLMSLGYWAWSEKIANMLPFDYTPSKQ